MKRKEEEYMVRRKIHEKSTGDGATRNKEIRETKEEVDGRSEGGYAGGRCRGK